MIDILLNFMFRALELKGLFIEIWYIYNFYKIDLVQTTSTIFFFFKNQILLDMYNPHVLK
jgi:hypothetical protein